MWNNNEIRTVNEHRHTGARGDKKILIYRLVFNKRLKQSRDIGPIYKKSYDKLRIKCDLG